MKDVGLGAILCGEKAWMDGLEYSVALPEPSHLGMDIRADSVNAPFISFCISLEH